MPKEPPPKPKPRCPTCDGESYRREVVKLYDEAASQKKPLIMLTCKKCSHVLMWSGGSNIFDLS